MNRLLALTALALMISGVAHADAIRYGSLAADTVTARSGPSERFDATMVYTQRGAPVAVIGRAGEWLHIRDRQGEEGWVPARLVSRERTVLIEGEVRSLFASPATPRIVARAEPGVIARLERCDDGWCRVSVQGITGWIERSSLWGADERE